MDDVRYAYMQLRKKYGDATHIMCAYRIEGANEPANQDYADDGEHGGGHALFDFLKEQGIMNRAVFVTRKYSGRSLRQSQICNDTGGCSTSCKSIATQFDCEGSE